MIVPDGFDDPLAGFTLAVSVTGEFCVMVATEVASVVLVLITVEFTFTVMALDVEALNVLFPV